MEKWLKPQAEALGPLYKRLNALSPLSESERRLVQLVEARFRRSVPARARFPREKPASLAPLCIQSGWAALVRELSDGRRQIVRILLPGDLVDVGVRRRLHDAMMLVALTPVKLADAAGIQGGWLHPERYPGLASAVDLAGAEDEHFLMNQVIRLGRQTAYERLASLLLELHYRLAMRGLAANGAFSLPLRQEILADTLGLSAVHINRTLQQMRREGMIELAPGSAHLLNIKALETAAEFLPPG